MSKNEITDKEIQLILEEIKNTLIVNKQMLAELLTENTLKPIRFSNREVQRCIDILEDGKGFVKWNVLKSGGVDDPDKQLFWREKRIPLGNVLGLTPFSSPYSSFIHKFANSFICKNTFYFKPSMYALDCSKKIFELVKESIGSKYREVLQLIELDDNSMESQMNYDLYDCILFTGKSETARRIKSKIKNKKAVFETGSSAMTYISAYADLELAAENIARGAFDQNGMRCVGAKNVFIHSKVFNKFLDEVIDLVNNLNCGDIFQESTDIGPLRKDLLPGLKAIIHDLIDHGYIPMAGGQIKRDILMPTILYDDNTGYLSTMEAFGPILCIHKVESIDDIPCEYFKRSSLSSAIYSDSLTETNKWISLSSTCSNIYINHGPTERFDYLPFGGFEDENDGKEGFWNLYNLLTKEQIIYQRI
ncbi:aldehyde dehydrogenase [Lacrimispora sp.]|uniref:aldehyde dehydrogenase n=1 Tax=Lacrimispora sp. TaxID=2719234 RepID=UPI0028A6C4A7|nr:aldehyde dehydrogenase [Lacrimispora sp.]